MKILIITQYFFPEEFRINDLAIELNRRGHEVTVLTGIPNYPSGSFFKGYHFWGPRKETYRGIHVIRAPIISRGRKQPWRLALNYVSFMLSASIVGLLYCRGYVDSLFVYEPSPITVAFPAIVLKKIKRIPLFLWVQDLWPESLQATGAVKKSWILYFVGRIVLFIYRNCDRILVQSRGFIKAVETVGGTKEHILYFPNWAETFYMPVTVPHDAYERALLPKGFIVMFAGNIGAAQDFPTILAAAERCRDMPEVHIVVLGDGRMRSWVAEEIERRHLGSIVHLLGRHPVEAMPRFFALANAMLVTLRNEPIFSLTIPSKVQSYLACGRPIIAALAGEGARVVDEASAGIVCPPENAEALANAIRAMRSQSDTERQRMGSSGRAYCIKYFDREVLCTRLEGWMREAVADTMSRVDGRRSEGVL